jgi:hypothetical protein
MEFMDLPGYMDSFQQGYGAAFSDLLARFQAAVPATTSQSPVALWPGQAEDWPGHHGHDHHDHDHHDHDHHDHDHHDHGQHEHGHREHRAYWGGHGERDPRGGGCGCGPKQDRDCGCRRDRECDGCEDRHDRGCRGRCEHDCRCDCCIVDADIIVYAHCGEIRVVPIEVANDTRKIRENVDVQVSDVRSAGGRVLAWPALIRPHGPLTLQPCSTTKLELLVQVVCGDQSAEASPEPTGKTDEASPAPPSALAALASKGDGSSDVDQCEVGYATIRLDGCLIRPIVVAIAVLPLGCDSYRAGCSCSCCC